MSAQAQEAYPTVETRPRRHLKAVAVRSLGGTAAEKTVSLRLSPWESALLIGYSKGRSLSSIAEKLTRKRRGTFTEKRNTVVGAQKALFAKLGAKNEANCVNKGITNKLIPIVMRPDETITDQLNPIDTEILGFIADGGTQEAFAEDKDMPLPAVSAYFNGLLAIIGASNQPNGVTRAYELGILKLPTTPTHHVEIGRATE